MTNFILNTNKIKALAGTLILTGNISQTMAVPCFRLFGNNRETYTVSDEILDDGKIEKIELDSKKYISVKDFGLKDEDGVIYKKVDGVKTDGKLKNVKNLIDVIIGDDIDGVLIGDELYNLDSFTFVNTATGEELGTITGVILEDGEIVDIVDLKTGSKSDDKSNAKDEEYVPLTEEKFYELVDDMETVLKSKNIEYKEEDVIYYLMVINADRLAIDNHELLLNIVGTSNFDAIKIGAKTVIGSRVSYDYGVYYGYTTESNFLDASAGIFDPDEKKCVQELQQRVAKIGKIEDDDEFNAEVVALRDEMYDESSKYYTLSSGTLFSLHEVFEPLRGAYGMRNFEDDRFNEAGLEAIKTLVPYVSDSQTQQDNNLLNGAEMNISDIVEDCKSHVKTRTLTNNR